MVMLVSLLGAGLVLRLVLLLPRWGLWVLARFSSLPFRGLLILSSLLALLIRCSKAPLGRCTSGLSLLPLM
ncbi:hypothetical protein D3C73_1561460 [compost metagenome]